MNARDLRIDALKALASQCIVLHHLAIYGPMPLIAAPLAPDLVQWLDAYGRYAVQVFLVMGGYLAAGSLWPGRGSRASMQESPAGLLMRLLRRFWRLTPTLWAALLLTLLVTAVIRFGLGPAHLPDHTPAWPSASELLANLLLLQDVLDIAALSAGIWYVAIDFQLYALLALLLWVLNRRGWMRGADGLVMGLTALSLLVINRDTAWEVWAPYFLGAYGLGILAWRATQSQGHRRFALLASMALLVLLALWVDWRDRIALAGLVAFVLVGLGRRPGAGGALLDQAADNAPGQGIGLMERGVGLMGRGVSLMGQISYSVFLVHYAICLAMNSLATFLPAQPALHAGLLALTWALSNLAGFALYHAVETKFAPGRLR
jgi:peptidoglycan/LPS O-acetylase OafA/YrhL